MISLSEYSLPPDLTTALKQAHLQYKPIEIKDVAEPSLSDDFISFIPRPAANESWAVGGQIVFSDPQSGEEVFVGDIAEYNPDDGTIFVDVAEWKGGKELPALKLRYRPYDYSAMLIGAFDKLKNHPALLKKAVENTCGTFQEEESAALPPLPPSKGPDDPTKTDDGIDRIWRLPWGILWGPPGTGKTQTIAQALDRFLLQPSSGKILVVTPTNIAADEIAFRLCRLLEQRGALLKDGQCLVYRGGRSAGKSLGRRYPECLRDKKYAELHDSLKTKISDLEDQRDAARHRRDYKKSGELKKELEKLRAGLPDETEFVIRESMARVIVLTTFKACAFVGDGDSPAVFEKLIIDEAGMVSRATCAAVATLGKSVLIAGDPKQIGPIFAAPPGLSRDARKWLLSSGLSHLTGAIQSRADHRVHFLEYQYRMHPEISKAVSEFTYDGILKDVEEAKKLLSEPPLTTKLPKYRAAYLVLDDIAAKTEDACPRKASSGVGWERALSAKVALGLASAAAAAKSTALIIAPYRAQVRLLRKLAKSHPERENISIGTIHRHQGAERDVVIADLVRGALAWSEAEICMMLNVAMSRAKKHFVLIASKAELATPVLSVLIEHLRQETLQLSVLDEEGRQQLFNFRVSAKPAAADSSVKVSNSPANTLGEEIRIMAKRLPLFSSDQIRLFDRNIGEGHYLVRGVAGSGKSLILANWAVRLIQKNPDHKILITYFNKGMHNLLYAMLRDACKKRWVDREVLSSAFDLAHVAAIKDAGKFNAVFVDEAQDMQPDDLRRLYDLCESLPSADNRELRNLILFYDDSQNVYGRQTLEELKESLPDEFTFAGRSFVLRETYRSTQSILSFAINMALDPKKLYSQDDPGLLRFMKVAELSKEGLLIRPEDSLDGFYHVRYAERIGTPPKVFEGKDELDVYTIIAREIERLMKEEEVQPGDIMVVSVKQPKRASDAIEAVGIKAIAYGGQGKNAGIDPIQIPAAKSDHVRCTTVFTCKGHEAPILFFANIQEVNTVQNFMTDLSPAQLKKVQRCMFYVGASRAMIRLYLYGAKSPFLDAAREYAKTEIPPPGLL